MTDLASMPHYTPRESVLSTPRVHPVFCQHQNGEMHESLERLLEHARKKTTGSSRPVLDEADLRAQMGVSPAVFSNWKSRGISKEGALIAEAKFGCSAHWLLSGRAQTPQAKEWPFSLLTPDDVRKLSSKALEMVERQALSLLDLETTVTVHKAQTDTVAPPKSEGFPGTQQKPEFMKAVSGKRSADPRTPRKTGNG